MLTELYPEDFHPITAERVWHVTIRFPGPFPEAARVELEKAATRSLHAHLLREVLTVNDSLDGGSQPFRLLAVEVEMGDLFVDNALEGFGDSEGDDEHEAEAELNPIHN